MKARYRRRASSSLIKPISYESRRKSFVSLKEVIFVKRNRGCTCRCRTAKYFWVWRVKRRCQPSPWRPSTSSQPYLNSVLFRSLPTLLPTISSTILCRVSVSYFVNHVQFYKTTHVVYQPSFQELHMANSIFHQSPKKTVSYNSRI